VVFTSGVLFFTFSKAEQEQLPKFTIPSHSLFVSSAVASNIFTQCQQKWNIAMLSCLHISLRSAAI